MGNVENITPYLEPIRKVVTVRRTPSEAFEIFTARLATWWPLARYSIHEQDAVSCGIEPRVGGEVYEVAKDGTRARWGVVLAWEPPTRLVLSWHPGRSPETAQEVEVRFVAVPEGTRVELEHRDWAKLGDRARQARANYEGGWAEVLDRRYVEACA
jgi:uncharacterized protein YndB with AHSA1/START domain